MTRRQTAPPSPFRVERDGPDLFLILNDVRIAYRGHPGTPQARTLVPLAPGWEWQADAEALTYRDPLNIN
jgi:hypothetical protein